MIMLTIEGVTHALTVEDATNLALAIAAEVGEPGQVKHFQGVKNAFSVGCLDAAGQADVETLFRAGITLKNC